MRRWTRARILSATAAAMVIGFSWLPRRTGGERGARLAVRFTEMIRQLFCNHRPNRTKPAQRFPILLLLLGALSAGWVLGPRSLLPVRHGFPNTASTTLLFLAAAAVTRGGVPARYKWSVVVGLGFSALGDAFLMLPSDRFVAGLCSFLAAHVCYLWALTCDARLAGHGIPFVACGIVAIVLLAWLWPGVPEPLRLPVVIYAAALLAMAAQATSRALSTRDVAATLAATGAVLFVVSDSVLAFQRFQYRLDWGRVIVLGTYFAAQGGIASSVLLYSKKRLADLASRCTEERLPTASDT